MNFLDFLGLSIDPVTNPLKDTQKDKRTKRTAPKVDAYYGSLPFVKEDAKDNEETFVLFDGGDTRTKEITPRDKEVMAVRGLREDKYTELKAFWAKGLSAAKVETMKQGQRGYGLRTLEAYWSAFALANSPLPVEDSPLPGGGGYPQNARKIPQMIFTNLKTTHL